MHRTALAPLALVTALTGVVLTGCSAAAPEPSASDGATRTVEHALGTTEIPVAPERVVTTTDQNALLPLLELGFEPVGSAGLIDAETGEESFRRTEGFDTAGIEFVGAYGEPNAEAIAALRPDLIIGYEFDEEYADQLGTIAPFVGVQIFGRRLPEALTQFADLVGRTAEADELEAEYESRIADLDAAIEERYPELTVSIVSPDAGGTFYLGDEGQAVGTVAYDLDLGRPAAQAESDRLGGSFTDAISVEVVDEHDADVMIVLDYGGDAGEGGFAPETQEFIENPLVQQLEAAQRQQLYVIDATQSVGAAWARMGAFLDELERLLLVDDLVVTGVNAE